MPDRRERRHRAWQQASPLSTVDVLQNGVIEHLFGKKLFKLGVLVFERPQFFGVRHIQPAKLRLSLIKRRRANTVFAANLGGRKARFLLFQDRDDLLV